MKLKTAAKLSMILFGCLSVAGQIFEIGKVNYILNGILIISSFIYLISGKKKEETEQRKDEN